MVDATTNVHKPAILLLGEIVLAHQEWNALKTVAELKQIKEGSREQFLNDCRAGHFNGIVAISRTFDSTQITGRFDHELVAALPSTVRFVSHNGAGYDSIDARACAARGISVSNTPGAVDASTASTAIYLMLGALRRSYIPLTALRAGNWRGRMQLTHDPENKLLGILGMGGIGRAVARRAVGFGMRLQYHNRRQLPPEKNPFNASYVGFEELLRTSDIISVHLPLNESTRGILGRSQFAMMKEGVVFVNTARGLVVDEGALVEALESGRVWGAGLDVYEREPIVHEGLLRNEHCVLMPHVGTATLDTQRKMELLVIENLKAAINEGRLVTPVVETQEWLSSNMSNGAVDSDHAATDLHQREQEAYEATNFPVAADAPATNDLASLNGNGKRPQDVDSHDDLVLSGKGRPYQDPISSVRNDTAEINGNGISAQDGPPGNAGDSSELPSVDQVAQGIDPDILPQINGVDPKSFAIVTEKANDSEDLIT